MATTSGLESWLSQLKADGKGALRALLDGTASLGRLSAAEPEDAVHAVLGAEAPDSEVFYAFDRGCLALAEEFRATLLDQKGRTFRVELAKLDVLISIIRRLLPPETVVDFRRRFPFWNGFFENFVVDRGLDIRREYFRILALSQEVAANHGLDARQLMPLWLSVCAESGNSGRYDPSYLRVALLGLRRLPLGEEFSANEDFALQGLARWAVTQRPSIAAFEREWRILEGDFPRDAGFWAEHVQAAVTAAERELSERTHKGETTFPIAGWWRQDVDLHPEDRAVPSIGPTKPPVREEREAVLREIGRPLPGLARRIDDLMKRHKRYADHTGDVFYLVRTACNIGMRLLENGSRDERAERGELAVSLASMAFEYDPVNPFAWSLMRDALASAGRLADAELMGWEAIRRFPEDHQWRTQLATMLAVHAGRAEEAAALLRETMALFPAEPHARAQLATVLADDLHKADEARAVLSGAIDIGVADDATYSLLRKLDQARALRRPTKPQARVEDSSTLFLPSAAARRQLFLFEAALTTQDAVRAFLAGIPRDSYATYVAERTGLLDIPVKTTFALAFEEALRKAEPSALRALIARTRPVERAIVEEAIAASEGRVVAFSELGADVAQNARLQMLEQSLQQGGRDDRRVLLLRDFAASTLSTSAVSLLAA